MPKYRITGPDGGTYEVTAPEGATQEDVLAYAQQNYKPKADFSGVRSRVVPSSRSEAAPKSRTMGDRYDSYISGVGKSMRDTGVGLKQLLSEGLEDRVDAVWNVMGRPGADKGDPIGKLRQYNERSRQEEARLRASLPGMAEDPEFAFGNVVGTLGQLFTPGAALRGTAAGRAALPATIKGNTLQGMALGTVQPVAEQGERAVNQGIGGLAGWLGATAPRALGAVTRPVRSAISDLLGQPTASGVERRAADLIRQEASDVGSLMRPQPSAVPGVQRTLAEESLDPGVARLERQLRGSGPAGVFAPIDQANAAARVRSIEEIAGTDAQMAAAEVARSQATGSLRETAMREGQDYARMSGMMQDLERARLMLQAQDVAALNAANAPLRSVGGAAPFPVMTQQQIEQQVSGVSRTDLGPLVSRLREISSSNSGNPAVQSTLDRVDSALGDARNSVSGLYNVRKYIDALLTGKAGSDTTAARAATAELMAMKGAIDDEIAGRAPTFADYLDAYRTMSRPINRMQIGRELLDRGAGSAIADPVTGVRPLTPAGFSRQANDLDSLAARATGFDKARADQILTPDDIAKIRAVQDDLERQAFRATAGSGGNSMTQERQALARRMGRSAIQSVPVVGRFAESLEAMGERRLNETLSRLIANPEEARRVLSALSAKDRATVNKALLQLSARTGASVPALTE